MSHTFETVMEQKVRGMMIMKTIITQEYIGFLNWFYTINLTKFSKRYMYVATKPDEVASSNLENSIASFKKDIRKSTEAQLKEMKILMEKVGEARA